MNSPVISNTHAAPYTGYSEEPPAYSANLDEELPPPYSFDDIPEIQVRQVEDSYTVALTNDDSDEYTGPSLVDRFIEVSQHHKFCEAVSFLIAFILFLLLVATFPRYVRL